MPYNENCSDGTTLNNNIVLKKLKRAYRSVYSLTEWIDEVLGKDELDRIFAADYEGPSKEKDELLHGFLICTDSTVDMIRQFINSSHAEFTIGKNLDVRSLTDYAIHWLFQESFSKNILTNGYRWVDGHVQAEYVSSATTILETYQWQWFQKQVGPCWFLFLILNASLFKPLPNRCYLQLTGDECTSRLIHIPTPRSFINRASSLSKASRLFIHKAKIMYSEPIRNAKGDIMNGFPRYYILYNNNMEKVLSRIFPLQFGLDSPLTNRLSRSSFAQGKTFRLSENNIPCRLELIAQIFKRILNRHRNFPYHILLHKICPEPLGPVVITSSLERLTIAHHRIQGFCKKVIRKLFPVSLYGSCHNWNIILGHVDNYIKARRGDSVPLISLFQKLRIKDIPWLGSAQQMSRSDFEKRQQMLLEFIYWFFDKFLVALLRNNFYITNTSSDSSSVYYYHHKIWEQVSRQTLIEFRRKQLSLANPTRVAQCLLEPSTVRVVPRREGYRIINIMGRSGSVNSKLRDVQSVLTTKVRESVTNYTYLKSMSDVLLAIESYRSSILKKTNSRLPKFYFVKVDITKSYDNIPLKVAHSLLSNLVSGELFWLHELISFDTRLTLKSYRGKHLLNAHDLHTSSLNGSSTFSELALKKPCQLFVDKAQGRLIKRTQIFNKLSEHLNHGLIDIDSTTYIQNLGIPQGSCLSGLICNIVYEDLIRKHLKINPETSVLLRYVDDFLLITTNQLEAMHFLTKMTTGFRSHGAFINPSKTIINFQVPRGYKCNTLEAGNSIQYLGVRIDTKTLDPVYNVNIQALKIQSRQMYHNNHTSLSFSLKRLVSWLKRKLGQELIQRHYLDSSSKMTYWISVCTITAFKLVSVFVSKNCSTINYDFMSNAIRNLIRVIVEAYYEGSCDYTQSNFRNQCLTTFIKVIKRHPILIPVLNRLK